MQLIIGALIIVSVVCATYTVARYLRFKEKSVAITSNAQKNGKNGDTHFQQWIDNVPFAKQQLVNIYNQTLAQCQKKGMSEEEAKPILDPILSKIKLLESVEKYEPIVRIGANIADTGAKTIQKVLKNIGDGV